MTEEAPPVVKTWLGAYAVVLGALALLIVAFYVFTKTFE
jgi:hypothetical protein